jgi:hypothetical protein
MNITVALLKVTAPSAKILIERERSIEHKPRIADRRDVPPRDVLIERGRSIKHAFHAADRSDVPPRDVIVECGPVGEQSMHSSDLTGDPFRDVTIHCKCIIWIADPTPNSKMNVAVCQDLDIPEMDEVIERGRSIKDAYKAADLIDVPIRDVIVEFGPVVEQSIHVSDVTGVSCHDIPIYCKRVIWIVDPLLNSLTNVAVRKGEEGT